MEELSVAEVTCARVLAGRARRVLAVTVFLLAVAMAAPMLARAANPAANIDQCRNGTTGAPATCTGSAWTNGDLGTENSHYREGDSVPFRATLTNLDTTLASHTLTIQYDTLQSGKHAYDYLTSYNRTEATADPTSGISGLTAGNCFLIPLDTSILFANPGSAQVQGCIQIWNGSITNVVYGTLDATGQRSVTVTFTTTKSTVLLAWGGHIASQIDWGAGNSASAISGAPYHMRLLTLDTTQIGNQDRSLKAAGILPIPPVFTTRASSSGIILGHSVTDTASLSGNRGAVTGTVTFFVCGPAASNPDCTSGGKKLGGPVTIAAGQALSDAFTPTALGHYCFRAEYKPDASSPYSPSNHTDLTLECFNVATHPHISVLKTPHEQTIVSGSSVSWTIQVINDGDSTLTDVKVTDAQAPGCARTKADIAGLASMPPAPAAGSIVTYTCSLASASASFTNVAVATATPPVGPAVSAQDSAHVTVIQSVTHPSISIVKNPKSQTVASGGTATFTITVSNNGNSALTNVRVTDALSPNCNRTIGTLAPGASVSYTCTRPNVRASFQNVAVASGTAGTTTVTARDTAPVTAKAALTPPTVKVKPKVVSHKQPKATG